jgi:hypothetical protein
MARFNDLISRRGFSRSLGAAIGFVGCACGRAVAQSAPEHAHGIPGDDKSLKSRALETGADLLQSKGPLNAINMYLNGFHFYADDMGRQIEAHHYCSHVTEDFFQCVIYDGNQRDARLIGIEYIVSEKVFQTLPEDEKPLWHSHRHETTSGELVMPGIPGPVEEEAMKTLSTTYGKTWHTWQIDRNAALPLGIPQLMMGFVGDGQVRPELVAARDQRLGISTPDKKQARLDLARSAPPVASGANSWTTGSAPQLNLQTLPLKNRRG